MSFIEAIKSFYQRYFDFDGRSSPSEYWWIQLFYFVILVLAIILVALTSLVSETGDVNDVLVGVIALPLILLYLGGIIPMIAVQVRRFHDQDKSGWMLLLSFIPYVGWIVVLVFMCIGGTEGDNRFGSNPLYSNFDEFR